LCALQANKLSLDLAAFNSTLLVRVAGFGNFKQISIKLYWLSVCRIAISD